MKSASGHFDVTELQKSVLGAENRVDNNIITTDAHTRAGSPRLRGRRVLVGDAEVATFLEHHDICPTCDGESSNGNLLRVAGNGLGVLQRSVKMPEVTHHGAPRRRSLPSEQLFTLSESGSTELKLRHFRCLLHDNSDHLRISSCQ